MKRAEAPGEESNRSKSSKEEAAGASSTEGKETGRGRTRTGGKTAKRSNKTEAGRTISRGSGMGTGTIRTLAGRDSLGGTLAAIVILSTDVALDRKLAKSSAMAEILTTITLRNSILGFQIFDGNPEVQEAREST